MADSVFVLGDVAFGLSGAAMVALGRTRAWRHPTSEVLDALPIPSFVGPGEDTISLDGVVFPGQAGDRTAINRLVALADAGEPQILADSAGNAYGQWVIESLDEKMSRFVDGGSPRKIEWSLRLRRYPDG